MTDSFSSESLDHNKRAPLAEVSDIAVQDLLKNSRVQEREAIGKVDDSKSATEKTGNVIDIAMGSRSRYEAMISDKENKHVTYAAYGNEVFPVVDNEGNEFPTHEKEYSDFLGEYHPEKKQVQDDYVGLLRDMTTPDEEDDEEFCQKYPNGVPMLEFARIAQLGIRSYEYQRLKNKLKKSMFEQIAFLQEHKDASEVKKMKELDKLGEKANEEYKQHVEDHLCGDFEKFGLTDEVVYENDPAELILMTFDSKNYTPRTRFEALRKVFDMREIGDDEFRHDGPEGLNWYTKLLDEAGYFANEKRGEVETFYLVAHHSRENGRKCKKAHFTRELPEHIDSSTKVKPIKMRRSLVPTVDENDNVTQKEIHFSMGDRLKAGPSRRRKSKIKDTKNPNSNEDTNAKTWTYDNMKEYKLDFRWRKSCLRRMGVDIREWDWKVSTDGKTFKKVERPGQSENLEIIKYKEEITVPEMHDDRGNMIRPMKHYIIEHMIFTGAMNSNYENQIDIMHDQYKVNRLFESSVITLTNPPEIYDYDPVEYQIKGNKAAITRRWSTEEAEEWERKFRTERGLEEPDNQPAA